MTMLNSNLRTYRTATLVDLADRTGETDFDHLASVIKDSIGAVISRHSGGFQDLPDLIADEAERWIDAEIRTTALMALLRAAQDLDAGMRREAVFLQGCGLAFEADLLRRVLGDLGHFGFLFGGEETSEEVYLAAHIDVRRWCARAEAMVGQGKKCRP